MTTVDDLATLPLHDATVVDLVVDWKQGTCTATVRGGLGSDGGERVLTWRGVSELRVAQKKPWGPSASILEASGGPAGSFAITMQSGGQVRLSATDCTSS